MTALVNSFAASSLAALHLLSTAEIVAASALLVYGLGGLIALRVLERHFAAPIGPASIPSKPDVKKAA